MTVHFICRGNVFRSVIAEAYLKSLHLPNVTVISSGTVADEFRASNIEAGFVHNTQELLKRHGLGTHHKSDADQLAPDNISNDQLVICVNAITYDSAREIVTLPPSTIVWDIVDIGEGTRIANTPAERKTYEEVVYGEIVAKVDELVAEKHLGN